MKQLSSFIKASGLQKRLFIFTIILSAYCVSYGQVYTTQLSGLNEAIPTSSPGTGTATVTITGTTMRVQATFSGLVPLTVSGQPSGVTASHIHAATAVAGEGTAGVATPVPTFPGFPSGVTSGTYDRTFDMTLATSYNPAYITANGGTPLSAFNALYAAINSGKAYFNIHTTAFPAGEIRGFFPPCPTINVSIPDAFALSKGVLPNTVYPAYSPASSLTLAATVSGGSAPYTYTWSNGATSATTTVSPTINTTYTVAVKDQRACPGTASKSITVMDIADGKKGDKIIICHKGSNSITLAVPAVSAHLDHGDMLGGCPTDRSVSSTTNVLEESPEQLSVKAFPNPSLSYFDLQISQGSNDVQLRVYDLLGKLVESRSYLKSNQTIRLGSQYTPGLYMVEVSRGQQKQMLRLIKSK